MQKEACSEEEEEDKKVDGEEEEEDCQYLLDVVEHSPASTGWRPPVYPHPHAFVPVLSYSWGRVSIALGS